jgi:hypothetical protein
LGKFDVIDWGTLDGTFSSLKLPALTDTLGWNASNLYSTGTLSVVDLNKLPGDLNRDGQVTAADLDALQQALVDPAGYEAQYNVSPADLAVVGDANESGTFDNGDLQGLIYELNHGTNFLAGSAAPLGDLNVGAIGSGDSPAAVPEPASIAFLLVGCSFLAFTRKRFALRLPVCC